MSGTRKLFLGRTTKTTRARFSIRGEIAAPVAASAAALFFNFPVLLEV
jgi:hypothetical protein